MVKTLSSENEKQMGGKAETKWKRGSKVSETYLNVMKKKKKRAMKVEEEDIEREKLSGSKSELGRECGNEEN